jgi:hypothetical protein
MSNATAIAAVTGALCSLFGKIATLQSALADLKVTAVPPDQAGTDVTHSSLNVFLYQVTTNAAWRNMNVPRQNLPGSTASPPPDVPSVALDLNYVITAYGRENDDTLAHVALAEVVSLLADNASLPPQLIQQAAVNAAITGIDLHQQLERVRLTPKPLTVEETSKLWTIFQAKYRISVSYQASVVLIDSAQASRAPLPVIAPTVAAVIGPPAFPTLTAVTPPNGQPSARLGDRVVLSGYSLDGSNDNLVVMFQSALVAAPLTTAVVTARSATSISVQLPNDATAQASWPAGPYLVSINRNDPPPAGGGTPENRTSNALPIVLAPTIVSIQSPAAPRTSTSTIGIVCSPEVWPQQRLSLVVANSEVPIPAVASTTANLSFPVPGLPPGTFFVRLRVDGVESLLVSFSQPPLAFDSTQQVTLP